MCVLSPSSRKATETARQEDIGTGRGRGRQADTGTERETATDTERETETATERETGRATTSTGSGRGQRGATESTAAERGAGRPGSPAITRGVDTDEEEEEYGELFV